MNDTVLVSRFQRLRNLLRNWQGLVQCDRTLGDAVRERRALDELHDQCTDAARVLESVDLRDVGVVERCQHLRLAFEPREAIGVVGDGRQEHFERHIAMEFAVVRQVDFAHPSASQVGADLVRAKASAGGENHDVSGLCVR